MIRKLSARQFKRAVRLGHGSALLHVRQYGDNGLENALIDAMLNSYVYDWQIEGSRRYWIFNLITATNRTTFYAEKFLEKIQTHHAKGNDRAQQIQLCGKFFELGYVEAREAAIKMYPALVASNPYRIECGSELIDMAAEAGLEFAAKTISEVASVLEPWNCSRVYDRAVHVLDLNDEPENFAELIKKYPAGRRFYETVKRHKADDTTWRKSTEVTPPVYHLGDILKLIAKKEHAPGAGRYLGMGKNLDRSEVLKAFELLKASKEPWEQLCFLRIFHNLDLPAVSPQLFELIKSPDKLVANAASIIFGKVKNVLVREKAFELLKARKQREIAFGVNFLESNYVEGDAEAVLIALKRMKNSEQLHRAGMSIQTIAKNNHDTGLEKVLLWLYENNPDSFCREHFLDLLIEWNICSPQILYEAQWDCCDEIQSKARRLSQEATYVWQVEATDNK